MHEGEKFYPGEKVVLQKCQYTCQCNVTEGYSFFMCEPLCKLPFDVMCADGGEPEVEMEDSSVPECKCPRYYCPERLSVDNLIGYVSLARIILRKKYRQVFSLVSHCFAL